MFLNPWYGATVTGSPTSLTRSKGLVTSVSPGFINEILVDQDPVAFPFDSVEGQGEGWTVHCTQEGRLYYCNHATRTSSWIPPMPCWRTSSELPYGWEIAYDQKGRQYFINHISQKTTYEDPRKQGKSVSPFPREVVLNRHPELGFGFVAGSEKPVIVRFVTEGGPSVDKLSPGDQIWMINGEDVRKVAREVVIQLVRSCTETVRLTVCQPPLDNSSRKSAFLSNAKKAKLKSNPCRVRFAEGVVVNGSNGTENGILNGMTTSDHSSAADKSTNGESYLPLMPNVLKVFLENGQTKSFKYDESTTVQDVLDSLQQKLTIQCIQHFALVIDQCRSFKRNKLTILDPGYPLCKIASQPGAHFLRCLFRVTFVPRDACELLKKDPIAFEYLYVQCCNDVVQERFAPELKYEIALRLAALHIYQHVMSNNMSEKVSIKAIEKEFGLERFVPQSLIESMKRKELLKLLQHFLRANGDLVPTGQKKLTVVQAKLHYLRIIGELPSYGAKCFATNIRDSARRCVLLISPRVGLSCISSIPNSEPLPLCDIDALQSVEVCPREDETACDIKIRFKDPERSCIDVVLEQQDAQELIPTLQGYYNLFTSLILPVRQLSPLNNDIDTISPPPYEGQHTVQPMEWSYRSWKSGGDNDNFNYCRVVNLSACPPQPPCPPDKSQVPMAGFVHYFGIHQQPAKPANGSNDMFYTVDNNMNKMSTSNLNVTQINIDDHPPEEMGQLSTSGRLTVQHVGEIPLESNAVDLMGAPAVWGEYSTCHISLGEKVRPQEEESRRLALHCAAADKECGDKESTRSSLSQTDSETEQMGRSAFPLIGYDHSGTILEQTERETGEVNVCVGIEELKGMSTCESELTESDTDSLSTSPECQGRKTAVVPPYMKSSDSSFGLHRPDVLSSSFVKTNHNLQDILLKLQEEYKLPYDLAEGALYLDPDIIDLTMISPPQTPEEAGTRAFLSSLSTPPTPFADRLNIEAELRALALAEKSPIEDENGEKRNNVVAYNNCSSVLPTSWMNQDVDVFISMTIMPPPPETIDNDSLENHEKQASPNKMSSANESSKSSITNSKATESPKLLPDKGKMGIVRPLRDPAWIQQSPKKEESKNNREDASEAIPKLTVAQRKAIFMGFAAPPPVPSKPSSSSPVMRSINSTNGSMTLPISLFRRTSVGNVKGNTSDGIATDATDKRICGQLSVNQCEIAYGTIDDALGNVVQRLEEMVVHMGKGTAGIYMNEDKLKVSQELLLAETKALSLGCQQLVASVLGKPRGTGEVEKHVIKDNLTNCVTVLEKMMEVSEDVCRYTSSPSSTQSVLRKVQGVSQTFRLIVQIASQVLEKKSDTDEQTLVSSLLSKMTVWKDQVGQLVGTLQGVLSCI